MHLCGQLGCYLGPITLQLLQQQPRPAPPVLYLPNDTWGRWRSQCNQISLKKPTLSKSSVGSPNCSSECFFIALLVYYSKAGKSILVRWGLGFPVGNFRGSWVKKVNLRLYFRNTLVRGHEMIRKETNKSWKVSKVFLGVIGVIDPRAGTLSTLTCRGPSLSHSLPPMLIEDWRVNQKY